jgi:hypothetical protein
VFVVGLGAFGWIEVVSTFIIYVLYWILIPRDAVEGKLKKLALLFGIYALTLFVGTTYVLWQLALVGIFPMDYGLFVLLPPTFALNYVIMAVVCPVLLRTVSPRLKAWGIYVGNFWEWRRKKLQPEESAARKLVPLLFIKLGLGEMRVQFLIRNPRK